MKPLNYLCTIAAALCSINASAEILIFRTLEKSTLIGQGTKIKVKGLGYSVGNWDTGYSMGLTTFELNGVRYYATEPTTNSNEFIITEKVTPKKTTTSTVITRTTKEILSNGVYQEQQVLMKGKDTVLTISPFRSVLYPRSFKGTAVSMSEGSAGAILSYGSFRSLFLPEETYGANQFGFSVDQVVDQIRTRLISEGYSEFPSP